MRFQNVFSEAGSSFQSLNTMQEQNHRLSRVMKIQRQCQWTIKETRFNFLKSFTGGLRKIWRNQTTWTRKGSSRSTTISSSIGTATMRWKSTEYFHFYLMFRICLYASLCFLIVISISQCYCTWRCPCCKRYTTLCQPRLLYWWQDGRLFFVGMRHITTNRTNLDGFVNIKPSLAI